MPRWPAPQLEVTDPLPPESSKQESPVYDYQRLNPKDAETKTYPYDGKTVMVSNDKNQMGFAAIWRITRRLEGWKWVKTGKWVTPIFNSSLPIDPVYWRKFSNMEHS